MLDQLPTDSGLPLAFRALLWFIAVSAGALLAQQLRAFMRVQDADSGGGTMSKSDHDLLLEIRLSQANIFTSISNRVSAIAADEARKLDKLLDMHRKKFDVEDIEAKLTEMKRQFDFYETTNARQHDELIAQLDALLELARELKDALS